MTVSAVIPLRYCDCFDQSGVPLFELSGKPLWAITIGQALKCARLQDVIVAFDDDRFDPFLSEWAEQVRLCKRPSYLSEEGATNLDVLAFVAGDAENNGYRSEHLILLEITHPLRPEGIIDQVVEAAVDLNADSLITCRRTHYNIWRKSDGEEMTRIVSSGDSSSAQNFQELLGICSVVRSSCLETDKPFGDVIDIIPIDKFWATIDVRDADGFWLAEQYLRKLGASL